MPKKLGTAKKLRGLPVAVVVTAIAALNIALSANNNKLWGFLSSTTEPISKEQDLYDYPCYPSRQLNGDQTAAMSHPIVYIDLVWFNLHSETFYSFIHKVCSCDENKDPAWKVTNNTESTIPHFYIGPANFIRDGLRRIFAEFNTTTCGPIFIGKPPIQDQEIPALSIYTTTYASKFKSNHNVWVYLRQHLQDPRFIFICHDDAPELEGDNATSVYWLTPLHSRYIVPTFFPPTFVQRAKSKLLQTTMNRSRNPVFLVIGSFNDGRKRNIKSLIPVLTATQHYNFTIRFLGGESSNQSNETLESILENTFSAHDLGVGKKIELIPNTDAYEFMEQVGDVDIILPLVDKTNLYETKGYMKGKKLTSSISWALGFEKKMVLYQPLADIYGIQEDNESYWFYNNTGNSFLNAFRSCLEHFKDVRGHNIG